MRNGLCAFSATEDREADVAVLDRGVLTAEYCDIERSGRRGFFAIGLGMIMEEGVGIPQIELPVFSMFSLPVAE